VYSLLAKRLTPDEEKKLNDQTKKQEAQRRNLVEKLKKAESKADKDIIKAEIIEKAKNLKPYDAGHSLHVYDEKYEIDGVKYVIYRDFESGTPTVSKIVKNDYEHLRNQEPRQLELF
jgi:hypothetical protein